VLAKNTVGSLPPPEHDRHVWNIVTQIVFDAGFAESICWRAVQRISWIGAARIFLSISEVSVTIARFDQIAVTKKPPNAGVEGPGRESFANKAKKAIYPW
jgi:Holliday junction resolvase-like predicted endonuclease